MNRCPISYELCDELYSQKGLRLLAPNLKELKVFHYTAKEQRELAIQLASKISIQGVQPKLSAKLNVAKSQFETVETGGTFILKPPHQIYDELPQNEDVSMKMAQVVGLEIPIHGMLYNIDGSLTYFIKRFDRISRGRKLAIEDFSQLLGHSRETKYESSMEKLVPILDKHCTFPLLEKIKLFRLTIFNFLIGNEDMHLKNFSLIRREDKVEISPAYDLLNTTIVSKTREEIALPVHGKKSRLLRTDLIDYFGIERLGLREASIKNEMSRFEAAIPTWIELVDKSFLSDERKERYLVMLQERCKRLELKVAAAGFEPTTRGL